MLRARRLGATLVVPRSEATRDLFERYRANNMANRVFYVYILGSLSRRLYTGITPDLKKRVYQHRAREVEGHTKAYRINRLLYYETTSNVHAAISREKQIKAWRREKRAQLVEQSNPAWLDLAVDWFPADEPQAQRE